MSADPPPGRPPARAHWIVWLFAIVGLLGVLGIIFIAATILSFEGRHEPAEVVGATPESRFVVRDASLIEGTNLIRIEIAAELRRSSASSYSGGVDDRRNILLVDRASGAVRRLLPDNSRRITMSYYLPAQADFRPEPSPELVTDRSQQATPPPAYFALLVAQPEQSERIDLLIGTLAGGEQGYVMQDLEGVDGVWMQSPTRIGFIVRERRNLFYRVVDIPTLRVVQSRRIPIDER